MTYVSPNLKTKKALKERVASGLPTYAYEPGLGKLPAGGGWVYLEGPHYPEPHKWYAAAIVDADGLILSVK